MKRPRFGGHLGREVIPAVEERVQRGSTIRLSFEAEAVRLVEQRGGAHGRGDRAESLKVDVAELAVGGLLRSCSFVSPARSSGALAEFEAREERGGERERILGLFVRDPRA